MCTGELKKHLKDKFKKCLDSETDSETSEHELGYYVNDRVKLMQEVLKLIKPKKLLSMAPESMRDMESSAVNALLLEELLGISKERLRNILAAENLDYDSSTSSESAEEKKTDDIEIISLDDITSDSEIFISDDNCMEIRLSETERLELEGVKSSNKKCKQRKQKKVVVKKEDDKDQRKRKRKTKSKELKKEPETVAGNKEPVVNVLNLLELQARARAIRSQLANEVFAQSVEKDNCNKIPEVRAIEPIKMELPESDGELSSNSVILLSPENTNIVLVHSNSEDENNKNHNNQSKEKVASKEIEKEESVISESSKELPKQDKIADVNTTEEEYNDDNDVLIVTEDDINLEKESEKFTNSTWKTRWLESKKVKDVLKTTKLINNLRQNIKQKVSSPQQSTSSEIQLPEVVENKKDENTNIPGPMNTNDTYDDIAKLPEENKDTTPPKCDVGNKEANK